MARIPAGRTRRTCVHLDHWEQPFLVYGSTSSDRLWLHAWRLGLKHPFTSEDLRLEAPPKRFWA